LDEGVYAEVKVGSEHLRLFSEQNAQGVQASVYNRQCQEMDCPFGIRRQYRTRQTESSHLRRGLPQTNRQPGVSVIEVEAISRSVEAIPTSHVRDLVR
jgi:hypothetical protein